MTIEKDQIFIKNQANYFKSLFEKVYKKSVRDSSRNDSDFPIFNSSSKNFYIYQRCEKLLQQYIRNYLINPILEGLLEDHGFKVSSYLKEIRKQNRFNNEKIENYDNCPFQFIFTNKNFRIGIRYTALYGTDAAVRKLIKKYKIDKIIVIHFSDDFKLTLYSEVPKVSHYTIKQFFEEFINEGLYNYFLITLKKVIEEMENLIGFDTIPSLSITNMTSVKLSLRDTLKNIDFQLLTYNSPIEFNSLDKNDLELICSNIDRGKAQVLIGKSDFAQSYITSEYLYLVLVDKFNTNELEYKFDYTSVVAGYLKTIEQFLYQVLCYQMDNDRSEKWINRGKKHVYKNKNKICPKEEEVRKNPKNKGHYQVLVTRENLKFMDVSLGSLIWYISDNKDCWKISSQGQDLLKKLLDDYKNSVRNGYFHKHNLENIEVVKRIRENTLYLLCFIIGSLKDFDIAKFGFLDFSFNDFYMAVSKIESHIPVYIQETKTSQPQLMKRFYNQEAAKYDVDGLLENNLYFARIANPTIQCESVDDIPKNDLVIFNNNNVPFRAEYVRRIENDGLIDRIEFYRKY